MKKTFAILSLLLLSLSGRVEAQALNAGSAATAQNCTSVNLGTITWTFTSTYTCGRYATGDFWVTNSGGASVSIKSISPAYFINAADGSARNGSMLNPTSSINGYGIQGFDSRTAGQSTGGNTYNSGNNVGITMPLVITEGSSLLSSESYPDTRPGGSHQSYSKQIQVLTVTTANAAVGDFRPSYIATVSKASPANVSSIDYAKLHSVVPPTTFTNTYSTAYLDTIMVEPQIELEMSTKGRYLHAGDNYNPKVGFATDYGYGQNIGMAIGVLSMAVNSNYTNGQKANWVIRLIQHGIDLRYALDKASGTPQQGIRMIAGGSHTPAKIFVMAFAGWILNNADLAAWGNHTLHPVTNESNQYFYVAQSDINMTKTGASSAANCTPAEQYPQSSLNEPEWGSDHKTSPAQDNHSFTYHACYRDQVGQATNSVVLAMKMMGMQLAVNIPAMFEYYEQRYMPQSYAEAGVDTNTITVWQRDFWQTYKDITPPSGGIPPTNINPTLSLISAATSETTATTGTITLSYADSDGTVSTVTWARTAPTAASGSCSLAGGTATCSAMGLTGAANNAFTFTATDNNGGTATPVLANILRRTCPVTAPVDAFDVNGGWSSSLGPCWNPMTSAVMSIGTNGYAQTTGTLARHLAYMPWAGGAPDDYQVQVTSTSQVTESSFLLLGCFATYTSTGVYDGYVMSMQGLGTNLAKYTAGTRSSLQPNTQPLDGSWAPGETGRLECEDTGTTTVLRAYDQNDVLIVSHTDATGSRYTSGEAFAGGWGGATFDGFLTASIVGGPAADTTPPTLSISVPVSNPADTNDSTYNLLAGAASDDTLVTSITCLNVTTAASCTVTGVGPWTVASVTLQAGANVIRLQACDAVMNCSPNVETTLNYAATTTGTILVGYPGPARTQPYPFKGDQTNFNGVCNVGTDHVDIFVAGILVDSSFISGTTTWTTIKPIPIPKDIGAIVPVEFRCVQGDATYASSTLNVSSLRLPSRGR